MLLLLFIIVAALTGGVSADALNGGDGNTKCAEGDIKPCVGGVEAHVVMDSAAESEAETEAETVGEGHPYGDYSEEDITMLAQLLWGEARGVKSETERAAVVWCVLNRMDSGRWADDISGVVTAPGQFRGYSPHNPAVDADKELAREVLYSHRIGRGRVLPENYYYFTGDGERNYFRSEFESGSYWNWRLPSPYEN